MSRLEAAVKAWDHYWGDRYGDEALEEMGDEVKVALGAADAHDAAHDIHRVQIDEKTVARVVAVLLPTSNPGAMFKYEKLARRVLAAAVEADHE